MKFITELVSMVKDSKFTDQWQTPDGLFLELNNNYNFIIDACATKQNAKCPAYFTECLEIDWRKEAKKLCTPKQIKSGSIYMNPPYSDPGPFLQKAWAEAKHFRVVCLVSNSIITCRYMDFLDMNLGLTGYRKFDPQAEIIFLTKRTKFYHPKKRASSPTGGCMLIVMDRRNGKK